MQAVFIDFIVPGSIPPIMKCTNYLSILFARQTAQFCVRPCVLVPRPRRRQLYDAGAGLHGPGPGRGQERVRRLQRLRVRLRTDG